MGMQEFHKLRQKKSSLYGVPLLPLQSLHIRAPKHFFWEEARRGCQEFSLFCFCLCFAVRAFNLNSCPRNGLFLLFPKTRLDLPWPNLPKSHTKSPKGSTGEDQVV